MTELAELIIICSILLLSGAISIWALFAVRNAMRERREMEDFDRRWEKSEMHMDTYEIAAAQAAYGGRWREALLECKEAHLPGDCWICGAE